MNAVLKAVETPQQAARRLAAGAIRDGFKPVALHVYEAADGTPLYWRIRCKHPDGRKWMRPMMFDGTTYTVAEPPAPPAGKPLYKLPTLLAAAPGTRVFIVEGEACADALAQVGILAATSGGSSSADSADWAPLQGRSVVLWPDNDEAGRKYAEAVTAKLQALGCPVEWIAPDVVASLPAKGDCVDWLAQHPDATAADLLELPTVTAPRAGGNSWPELVPLEAPNLPSIDLACLPDWAGDYARALAEATETPPELAAGMVLATCATAAARRVRVNVKPGYFEPCNLWIVAALPPGNRKSSVQAGAAAPLVDWEREQAQTMAPEIKRIASERKTAETRAKALRDKAAHAKTEAEVEPLAREAAHIEADLPPVPMPPQLWTSDATPERLGVLLADNGECMAWLSSEGGIFDMLGGRYSKGIPNLDLVLKAHSGDAERVDRGSRPPVYLLHPTLSIGLSPQPSVLHGLASKSGFAGRGLLDRFLYLLPPSPLGYRQGTGHPVPEGIRAAYAAGIRAMLDWEPSQDANGNDWPHVLKMSTGALSEWREFWQAIETNMRPGGELEHFTGWGGKAPGAAARIAGVLHAIQHAHGTPWDIPIAKETMDAALELMAVITRHSIAAFGTMGADVTLSDACAVLHWIERNRREQFTVREVFNALKGSFGRVAKLAEALDALQERGYVNVIEPPTSGKAGRPPSPVVHVCPSLIGAWR